MGPKKRKKNMENHMEGELDKPDNAFSAKPYHAKKIGPQNQNMEHCKRTHPYPKGQ
jgi:hypothetical protein